MNSTNITDQVSTYPLPGEIAKPDWYDEKESDLTNRSADGALWIAYSGPFVDVEAMNWLSEVQPNRSASIHLNQDIFITNVGLEIHKPCIVVNVEENGDRFTPAQARTLAAKLIELADVLDAGE